MTLDLKALEELRNELEGEYGEKVIGKQTLYELISSYLEERGSAQARNELAWLVIDQDGNCFVPVEYAEAIRAMFAKGPAMIINGKWLEKVIRVCICPATPAEAQALVPLSVLDMGEQNDI